MKSRSAKRGAPRRSGRNGTAARRTDNFLVRRASDEQIAEHALELCCDVMRQHLPSWSRVAARLESHAGRCRELAAEARKSGADATAGPPARELGPSRIVHDWFRLPAFIDERGMPVPLRLWGKSPSVEAIARLRLGSAVEIRRSIEALRKLGALRRTAAGKYLPRGYTMMLQTSRQAMRRHGAQLLDGLVSTLAHNRLEKNPAAREFERMVHSPRVRIERIPAFRRFLAAHGQVSIEAIDHWLEEHQAKPGARGEASAEVIVALFSHSWPNDRASRTADAQAAEPRR